MPDSRIHRMDSRKLWCARGTGVITQARAQAQARAHRSAPLARARMRALSLILVLVIWSSSSRLAVIDIILEAKPCRGVLDHHLLPTRVLVQRIAHTVPAAPLLARKLRSQSRFPC